MRRCAASVVAPVDQMGDPGAKHGGAMGGSVKVRILIHK